VVEKDRSLTGFVDAGFAEFAPLIGFRDWLASIRNDPNRRMARRRNGRFLVTKEGVFVPGPFTFETRREVLERVFTLQAGTDQTLISEDEVARIRRIWAEDAAQAAAWEAEAHPSS
jgi:DNA sulfur modification protein DndC